FAERTEFDVKAILGAKGLRHADRGAFIFAAMMAASKLGDGSANSVTTRLGAVVGGAMPSYSSVMGILRAYQRGGPKAVPPMLVPFATVNVASSWWMLREQWHGFNGCPVSGDCAGLDALLWAKMQINENGIDRALAGATEGYSPELWKGLAPVLGAPISEGAAAVWVDREAYGAQAVLLRSARCFDRANPGGALERALDALNSTAKIYRARSRTQASVDASAEVHSECLSVSGMLALHWALDEIQPGEECVVASDSRDGFATAILLSGV
ncbi:MAG: hypothetical protein AAFQ82_27905, partial [Myxococcota bacterium]